MNEGGILSKKIESICGSQGTATYTLFLPNFSTTFMLSFCKTATYVTQHIRFFPLVKVKMEIDKLIFKIIESQCVNYQ